MKGNKGKQSPHWAFFNKQIIGPEDNPYLKRLRVVQTPWFGVFIHNILRPDADPDPHNHPWNFASLVIRGGYGEEVWEPLRFSPRVFARPKVGDETRRRYVRRGMLSRHAMKRGPLYHRIVSLAPGGCMTLVFVGRRADTWGFLVSEPYYMMHHVHWKTYLGAEDEG